MATPRRTTAPAGEAGRSAPATSSTLDLAPWVLPLHDRWVLASQIAHRVAPAVWTWGGFATAEVRVAVPWHVPRRPAVAVVLGALPVAPVVDRPPLLVIELAPICAPADWLARGVAHVWSLGRDGAWVHTRRSRPRRVGPEEVLRLASPRRRAGALPLELVLPVDRGGAR